MSDNRNLPVVAEEHTSSVVGENLTASADHGVYEQPTPTQQATRRFVFPPDFGKQMFFLAAGITLLIFALIFAWGILTDRFDKDGVVSPRGAVLTPSGDIRSTGSRSAERDYVVGIRDTQNGVTVEIQRLSSRSRHIGLEIRITNNSYEPVSFLGLMSSQLIDDKGRVYPVDFSSADGFITINPGASIVGVLRFTQPLYNDAERLTLVINDVGTLKNRWYYEITFDL